MFLNISHGLNRIGLSWLVAIIRWMLWRVSPSAFREHGYYAHPENVGYKGWRKVRGLGCLAFIRLDGTFQYRW